MRKLVLALALVAIWCGASGCKHPGSAKLEGRWRGVRAEGVTGPAADAANNFAKATEIIARGDKITVNTPDSKGQQGTYVVDSENKTTVVLHTDKDGTANKETLTFGEDGASMVWRLGEGRTIVFQRLKD